MAKTDKTMLEDQALEVFFDASRSDAAMPSDDLVSAILADATQHQRQPEAAFSDVREDRARRGGWASLISAIGGWPALTGMATATVAGVWIGFAAPAQLETISGGLILTGDYTVAEETYALEDLVPSYLGTNILMEEEG